MGQETPWQAGEQGEITKTPFEKNTTVSEQKVLPGTATNNLILQCSDKELYRSTDKWDEKQCKNLAKGKRSLS